jgi:Methyltransferase domain
VKRIVQPELLDTLPPNDPRARHSRRDLCRINWWMRNHAIMANALQNFSPAAPQSIMELGAGDGKFLLRVAQKLSSHWPGMRATLLDLQSNVSSKTLVSFREFGWRAETIVADVFAGIPDSAADQIVIANLFLHHFEDARLSELLGKISRQTKLFIAVEPRRFTLASIVRPLLWLIGCNEVTRHDAVISIRAGFSGMEISALWPDKENWELFERRAGIFSHLFIARRRE